MTAVIHVTDAALTGEIDEMGRKLREAKKAGEVARMRITGTCMLIGPIGSIGGVVLGLVAPYLWLRSTFSMCAAPSLILMLSAVLPTDKRLARFLIKLACWLATLYCAIIVYAGVMLASKEAVDECVSTYDTKRWYCSPYVPISWIIYGVNCITVAYYLASTVAKKSTPSRVVLGTCWKGVALILMFNGLYYIPDILVGMAAGFYDNAKAQRQLPWTIIKAANFTFWGWLCYSDRVQLRQRVQSALLARGGQVSSAAGIAALMGSHSPKQVRDLARGCFYGTTLEQITYDELAENSPNPALFARMASSKALGEVDWFVSHSWRDPAPHKWGNLQRKRDDFKREHGREPIIWFDKVWRVRSRAAPARRGARDA